jgi:hypothetical protein
LNAPACVIESNDCAFAGPCSNEHTEIDKSLQCSGRVMVLFRQLARSTARGESESLKDQLHLQLLGIDPLFLWASLAPPSFRCATWRCQRREGSSAGHN